MRTAATFMLCGLVAGSLTACGGASATGAPKTSLTAHTVTPAPTAARPAAAGQRNLLTAADARFKTNTVTGDGLTAAQLRDAKAAYKTAVLFTMNEGMNGPTLTKRGTITAADLAAAKAAMTPGAFKDLKAFVTKANAGDAAAVNEVFVVFSMDLTNKSEFSYRAGGAPVVARQTFGSAPGTVMDKTTVWLDFKVSADYRLLNAKKKPITAHVKRSVSYSMDRSKTGWLISGWTIKQTAASITDG